MFRPISPSPPNGIALSRGGLAKEFELLLGRLERLRPGKRCHFAFLGQPEMRLHRLEILLKSFHQEAVIQGCRWMVDRYVGDPGLLDDPAMHARDRIVPRKEARQGVPSQDQDNLRLHES